MRVFFFLYFLFSHEGIFGQQPDEKQSLRELAGYHYQQLALNADSSTEGLPIVIGLHWSGSTPEEFSSYLLDLTIPVRLILVQAPYPHKSGFSFFSRKPVDYYTLPPDEKMVVLLQEGEKLGKFIEAITGLYQPFKKPVLIGASQGGDLSYVIGIRYNQLISHSFPLLATMDERILISPGRAFENHAPFDVFHGDADPIVNIDMVQEHIGSLEKNHYKVKLHVYKKAGHDITVEMKKNYTLLINDEFKQ